MIFGDKPAVRFPTVSVTMVVDEERFDGRVRAELFDHRVRVAGSRRSSLVRSRDLNHQQRLSTATSGSRAATATSTASHITKGRRRRGVPTAPTPGLWVGASAPPVLDHGFELGAHHIGQLSMEPAMDLSGVHQFRNAGPHGGPGHPPRIGLTDPRQTRQIRRRHVRRPLGPLRIRVFVGESHHRSELFCAQAPRVRRRCHRWQHFQRPGGFERLAHPAGRFSVPTHGRIDLPPLVEDPHHREFLDPGLALHPHQLVSPRDQPLGRPAPQPVEMIGNVEHPTIKSWGCDT